MELCANTIALRDYEDRQEREERQHEIDHPDAMAEAIEEALKIIASPALMTEAVNESNDSNETAAAICTLLIATCSEDDKRKARQVLASAVASFARWSSSSFVQQTLTRNDDAAIAKAVLEVLP